jgi:hypothetical protein
MRIRFFSGMRTSKLFALAFMVRPWALTLSMAAACPAPRTTVVAPSGGPGAAQGAAPPPDSTDGSIPPLKFPGLSINASERCLDVDATICLSEGALELIACHVGGKVHESIVAVEARPSHIHTALLLLGASNGNPAMRRPIDEKQTRWVDVPPTGDLIDIFLEFPNADGKPVERPISDFIRRRNRDGSDRTQSGPKEVKAQGIPHAFIFAGSHLRDHGEGPRGYLADFSGHVISMSTFGDELLCLPEIHSHQQGALEWEINPTDLPKKGTAVTLRLRLAKNPATATKSESKP